MTDTPQQPSRLDRIESILATVAEQQATNTQAIANEWRSDCQINLTLEQYIALIHNIPDIVMRTKHGIYLEAFGKNEKQLLKAIRERYRYTAMWLEYYLLNRREMLFELTLKPKIYYKPYAERDVAVLKLAQEIFLRSELAQTINTSPAQWMLRVIAERCDTELKNSGFIGKANVLGKSGLYKETKIYYDELADVDKFEIYETPNPEIVNYEELLQSEAVSLAKKDTKFKNTYWRDYLTAQKRFYRVLRDSPLSALVLEESEKLRVVGNGKRGKAKPDDPEIVL